MSVNFNSTFADVSILDRAALYAPHWLYASRLNPQFVTYFMMITGATTLVIIGSYATISQPKLASDPIYDRQSELWDPTDRDGSNLYLSLPTAVETLNSDIIDFQLALLFPALAAATLYGLDFLIRLFDIQKIKLLNYYVTAMVIPASYITTNFLVTVLLRSIGYALRLKSNLGFFFNRYLLTLSKDDKLPLGLIEQFDTNKTRMSKSELKDFESYMLEQNNIKLIKLHKLDAKKQSFTLVWDFKFLIVAPISLAILVLFYNHNPTLRSDYDVKKINWIANNLSGSVLAVSGICLTRLGNFKVGVLFLLLLFAYDIYFVFGSTLMVSVASNLELPVKLVVPNCPKILLNLADIQSRTLGQLQTDSSMLGLGDIVVPATFASLCLRFDYHRFYERTKLPFHHLRGIGFPKYFTTAVISYVFGLLLTVVANLYSGHGQPALLYLVPSLVVAVFGVAKLTGEFTSLWTYSEEIEEYSKSKAANSAQSSNGESSDADQYNVAMQIVTEDVMYEFEITEDESDDTYIIEEDTDEDEEVFEIEDLTTEIDFLIRDQQEDED